MPPAASKAISKAVGTFFDYFCFILCCPCFCGLVVCGGVGGKCGGRRMFSMPSLPDPPPLPTPRIDIQHLPVKEQPQSCYLLSKLPLELRQCIFEQVLGGRLIDLLVVTSKQRRMVRSQCYIFVDNLAHARTRNIPAAAADQLSPALLRSCRQIYTEALPILHQRNTFSFWASELEVLVRCGLGEYCLPDICSVYVYEYGPFSKWRDVFVLLRRMGLERVAFEFRAEPEMKEFDPRIECSWARHVLKLRNLRRLELWLDYHYNDAKEDPELVERLRGLMIGPGAEERYRMFLEQCRVEAQQI